MIIVGPIKTGEYIGLLGTAVDADRCVRVRVFEKAMSVGVFNGSDYPQQEIHILPETAEALLRVLKAAIKERRKHVRAMNFRRAIESTIGEFVAWRMEMPNTDAETPK